MTISNERRYITLSLCSLGNLTMHSSKSAGNLRRHTREDKVQKKIIICRKGVISDTPRSLVVPDYAGPFANVHMHEKRLTTSVIMKRCRPPVEHMTTGTPSSAIATPPTAPKSLGARLSQRHSSRLKVQNRFQAAIAYRPIGQKSSHPYGATSARFGDSQAKITRGSVAADTISTWPSAKRKFTPVG